MNINVSARAKAFHQVGRVLAMLALVVNLDVHAAAINTGVEELLRPVVILAAPFLMVHEFLFGSDSSAQQSAEKEANKILEAFKEEIPVNGLYTGPVNLRWALYGMLVESRLPFVEVDTAGSAWLLSNAKDSQPLIRQAERHKYIRLSFGRQGNANCYTFKSSTDDWPTHSPVRPGTCMLIVFENQLQSDLQLRVNTSQLKKRKLRWEIIDRSTGRVRISIPFWESQSPGKPLRVSATYRAAYETDPFIRILRKLSPAVVPKGLDGKPYVMNRADKPISNKFDQVSEVQGEFRVSVIDWKTIKAPENEDWKVAYERGFATGKPVILNNSLLFVPRSDTVGPACANPRGSQCDFAKNSVSDIGVLTATYDAAYSGSGGFRSPVTPLPPHDMAVNVAARNFDGKLLWYIRITPASLPIPYQICKDFSLGCYFYPRQATTTTKELVIRGVFGGMENTKNKPAFDEYELVVPLAKLPLVATAQ